jgi:hypothetical protein
MATGFFSHAVRDYKGRVSVLRFRVATLTAANFNAQENKKNLFLALVGAIGARQGASWTVGNENILSLANAPTEAFQAELKWRVTYKDNVTLRLYHIEIPCAVTTYLDPKQRDLINRADATVIQLVSAFQNYALSPRGNAITVMEIRLVGRAVS